MAYDKPTPADFKARYPTVAGSMTDPQIQAYLDDAALSVDDSWIESNFKPAIMTLAAHLIMVERNGGADGAGAGSGVIASESFGGMSISYDNSKSADNAAANSKWGATIYGQRFYELLKLNKPAVVSI